MGWSTSLLRPAVRGQAYTNFQMGEIVDQKPDNSEDLDPDLSILTSLPSLRAQDEDFIRSRNYRDFWIVTPPSKLRGLISDRFFCDDQIIPYPSMNWRLVSERYFFAKTLEAKKKFLAQCLSVIE